MCPNQRREAVLRNIRPRLSTFTALMFPFILVSSLNTFTPISQLTWWLIGFRAIRPLSHLWKQHLLYSGLQKVSWLSKIIPTSHSFWDDDNAVNKQTFSPPDLYLHKLIHLQCNLQLNLVRETVIVLYWILMSARWTQTPLYAVTVSYDRRLKERVISAVSISPLIQRAL